MSKYNTIKVELNIFQLYIYRLFYYIALVITIN